jgi:hypothetical protein
VELALIVKIVNVAFSAIDVIDTVLLRKFCVILIKQCFSVCTARLDNKKTLYITHTVYLCVPRDSHKKQPFFLPNQNAATLFTYRHIVFPVR